MPSGLVERRRRRGLVELEVEPVELEVEPVVGLDWEQHYALEPIALEPIALEDWEVLVGY